MRCLRSTLSLALLVAFASLAVGGEVPLIGYADGSTSYYEYPSESFVRMVWTHPTQPTHQSYRNIYNPSIMYGAAYDAFPNDNEFRMGAVQFDESGLVGGTGDAPITGVTFAISRDPFDNDYINWERFTNNTIVKSFTGTVQLVDGAPTGMTLSIDLAIEMVEFYYAPDPYYYDGKFTVSGNNFALAVDDVNTFPFFGVEQPVRLEWDFTGTLYNLPLGDFNADSVVDSLDYDRWAAAYGSDDYAADANGDRIVDAADYTIWRDNAALGASTAVPEPTTITAVVFALCGLGAVSRRA